MTSLAAHLPLASGGSFLITPNVGLMVWTLVVFLISFFVLRKWVYPVIGAALDSRANRINESIDAAEKTRHDADQLLADYRERLKDARGQADEIIARARTSAEAHERIASEEANKKFGFLLDALKFGCPPHGGFGLGLARLLMTLLGLDSIRDATFLFRGPNRLTP